MASPNFIPGPYLFGLDLTGLPYIKAKIDGITRGIAFMPGDLPAGDGTGRLLAAAPDLFIACERRGSELEHLGESLIRFAGILGSGANFPISSWASWIEKRGLMITAAMRRATGQNDHSGVETANQPSGPPKRPDASLKPFWLVWREGGGTPTVQHETEDAARAEAERLAKHVPGARFFVLRTEAVVATGPVAWQNAEPASFTQEIPF